MGRMGTDASSTTLTNQENLSPFFSIPDESCGVVQEAKNHTEPSPLPSASTGSSSCSLEPVTPDSNPHSGYQFHRLSSPLTVSSLSPNVPGYHSYQNSQPDSPYEDSLLTPKENVFDPFAPAPDKFMLAPLRRKCAGESKTTVVRQLNFNSGVNLFGDGGQEANRETILDEEKLFELVYGTLLEAVVSEKIKELARAQVSDPNGFRTPTSAPHLSGVADTCPGAPVKSSTKFRVLHKNLCRKLEF